MMKPDDIRKILERYYDGSATVGEIESVKRYFDETSDVPADLRADAAMFRAMSRHQQQVAPPADLEKKILAATVDASPAKRRFGWKIAFAAAAAAAVIITVATMIFNIPRNGANDQPTLVARSSSGVNSEVAVSENVTKTVTSLPVIADNNLPAGKHVANPAPRKKAGKRIHKARSAGILQEETLASNYREVTDSAEAVQITNSILATLAENLAKAENGINESEAAMRSVRERLDRIYERL